MWNIEIGVKPERKCCSATSIRKFSNGYSISENSDSFWISENFIDQ